jgi:hypothetical protein
MREPSGLLLINRSAPHLRRKAAAAGSDFKNWGDCQAIGRMAGKFDLGEWVNIADNSNYGLRLRRAMLETAGRSKDSKASTRATD